MEVYQSDETPAERSWVERSKGARDNVKHAIAVLEEAIAKKGFRMEHGAEIEFCVKLNEETRATHQPLSEILRIYNYNAVDHSAGASRTKPTDTEEQRRTDMHPDAVFPFSGRVGYCYLEEGAKNDWHKLEVILTHKPVGGHENTEVERDACGFARDVGALCGAITSDKLGIKPRREGVVDEVQEYAKFWRDFKRNNVESMAMTGYVEPAEVTCGLHINSSLWRADGSNALDSKTPEGKNLQLVIGPSMRHMYYENLALLMPNEAARQRYLVRADHEDMNILRKGTHLPNTPEGHSPLYMESKIPPVDADPYLATLVQLAGIYDGICEQEQGCMRPQIGTSGFRQRVQLADASQGCGKDLHAMLNTLEAGLGDALQTQLAEKQQQAQQGNKGKGKGWWPF